VTERLERRRKKLRDELEERKEYSHLKLKALARTMCRVRFGRDLGLLVRQTIE
jgi:hypothetical protein